MTGSPESYLNPATLPFPFCPGCGHPTILEGLDRALAALQVDPKKLVLISDIGCSGLGDQFFATNALHGLHGRSVTYATGVKLANPELTVVVLMGDGACGIGGHHLLNAARRNIGVTVVIFNNLNYGMTGGQQSVTTPPGGRTTSSPLGALERPMDICGTVAVNGATFVARTTTFDPSLPEILARAVSREGFSLVDVWELCPGYYAPANRLNRRALEGTLDEFGFRTGILVEEKRPELSRAYRERHAPVRGNPAMAPHPLEPRYEATLSGPVGITVAGAAGRKILSSSEALARGGVLAGLQATQKNVVPITVKSGFSMAEVILSPDPILYTGIEIPDILLILFPEGLARVRARFGGVPPESTLYLSSDLEDALGVDATDRWGRTVFLDFPALGPSGKDKDRWTLLALAAVVEDQGLYPLEALKAAVAATGNDEVADALSDAGRMLRH